MANIQIDPEATQTHDQILTAAYETILLNDPATNWMGQGSAIAPGDGQLWKYPDELRSETTMTLNANYTATNTTITVLDSSPARVGDMIRIKGHRDTSGREIVFRVTAIPGGGVTLTVTAGGMGSATDTNLTAAAQVIHITHTHEDNDIPLASESAGGVTEPTLRSNYFQNFMEPFMLGEDMMDQANAGLLQGLETRNLLDKAREEALYKLAYTQYQAYLHGVGAAQTATTGGLLNGIFETINSDTSDLNRVDAGAGVLVEDDINDLLALLVDRGLPSAEPLVLITSTANQRVLSALKNAKISYNENSPNGSFGGSVQTYNAEIPDYGQVRLILDRNFDDYFALLLSPKRINWHAKAGKATVREVDATAPGQHGTKRLLKSSTSLSVIGQNYYHGVIYNIAP